MIALYVWLHDELGNNLVKFCKENEQKKAHVVRAALSGYLKANRGKQNGTKLEGNGVEADVSAGTGEPQPAS